MNIQPLLQVRKRAVIFDSSLTRHVQSTAKSCEFYLLKHRISDSFSILNLRPISSPSTMSSVDVYTNLTGSTACTLLPSNNSRWGKVMFTVSRSDQTTALLRTLKGILLPSGQNPKTILRLSRPVSMCPAYLSSCVESWTSLPTLQPQICCSFSITPSCLFPLLPCTCCFLCLKHLPLFPLPHLHDRFLLILLVLMKMLLFPRSHPWHLFPVFPHHSSITLYCICLFNFLHSAPDSAQWGRAGIVYVLQLRHLA